MLKTYRIIPFAFILFLFGFTLITVSPVIADDSPELVACQKINPAGDFKLMKQKKNCFRDVARLSHGQSLDRFVDCLMGKGMATIRRDNRRCDRALERTVVFCQKERRKGF